MVMMITKRGAWRKKRERKKRGGEGEGEGEEEEGGGSIHKTRMMMMIAKRAAGQAAHCEDSGIREAVNRRMQRQRKVRYSCLRSVRAAKGQYGYGNIKVLRMRRGVGDWMRLRARAGSPSVDNLEYENSFRRWEMQRKDDEWMRKRREELKCLKVKELRSLIGAHMNTELAKSSGIDRMKKDDLMREAMRGEIKKEIELRLHVLHVMRFLMHKRRQKAGHALLNYGYGRDEFDLSLYHFGSELNSEDDLEDAIKENNRISLLSFSEQIIMFCDTIRYVQEKQREILLSGDEDKLFRLRVPQAILQPIDVIRAFITQIEHASSRKGEAGGSRPLVMFDPDNAQIRLLTLKVVRGEIEFTIESVEQLERILGRREFEFSEDLDMRLFRKAISHYEQRQWQLASRRVGDILSAEISKINERSIMIKAAFPGDENTVYATLPKKDTIRGEIFRVGDHCKVAIVGALPIVKNGRLVQIRGPPNVYVSRTEGSLVVDLVLDVLPASAAVFGVARDADCGECRIGITFQGLDTGTLKNHPDIEELNYIKEAIAKVGIEQLNGERIIPIFNLDGTSMYEQALCLDLSSEEKDAVQIHMEDDGGLRVQCERHVQNKLRGKRDSNLRLTQELLDIEISFQADDNETDFYNDADTDLDIKNFVSNVISERGSLFKDEIEMHQDRDYLRMARRSSLDGIDGSMRGDDSSALTPLIDDLLGDIDDRYEQGIETDIDSSSKLADELDFDDKRHSPTNHGLQIDDNFGLDFVQDEGNFSAVQSDCKFTNVVPPFREDFDLPSDTISDDDFRNVINSVSEVHNENMWQNRQTRNGLRTSRKSFSQVDCNGLELGEMHFASIDRARSFFKRILFDSELGYVLTKAETEAFISLIEKGHRCPEEKLGPDGLRSIYVGEKEFPGGWNRCYILVRKDRSEDDCSYVKLLRNIDRSVS